MIALLEDAWRWYENARKLVLCMRRLRTHHWTKLPREVMLDRRFLDFESSEVVDSADITLDDLDDLCIVLLFSVFESRVREQVLNDIDTSIPAQIHPAIERAVRNTKENIDSGSFFGVLECYKSLDPGLVEEVNQVRKYRNWVAHGRRGLQPDNVTPHQAFDRLQRFWFEVRDVSSTIQTPP